MRVRLLISGLSLFWVSSLGSYGCGFHRMIFDRGRSRVRNRRLLGVFGTDVEVVSGAFGDLFEDGSARVSAVISVSRVIHHYRDAKLGIIGGKETDERGEEFVDVGAIFNLLGGSSFTGNSVVLQGGF